MHLLATGSLTDNKNVFFNRTHLQKIDFFSVYNSKQRKTKKFNRARLFSWFETQNINTPGEIFYSFIPMMYGNVKENVSCASSGIQLRSIFEILGQKLEFLPHPPLFLDLPLPVSIMS